MNYYNEVEPYAAEWLRNLISADLIPHGDVDTRSIVDVRPGDLTGYTQCHFFAGLGGWSRALAIAGWPADRPVWTGSCPCQPFSLAGAGKGFDDDRDLWPVWWCLIRLDRGCLNVGRIRTIKPEFPQSETVGRLTRDARLLFIQIWTVADDYGRLRASPHYLAGQLYPYDDDARALMPGWLEELEAGGFIRMYGADGNRYLDIPQWAKHQRVDNAGKSNIPGFSGEAPRVAAKELASPQPAEICGEKKNFAANRREPPLDLGPRTLDQDLGPRTNSRAVADATRTEVAGLFDEFWIEYPRRGAANPKNPALKRFVALLATGRKFEIDRETAAAIIGGAKRYAAECRERGKVGTEHVAQAVTWLNQRRWEDYPEKGHDAAPAIAGKVHVTGNAWDAWDRYYRATRGRGLQRDKAGGWYVDAEFPPDEPRLPPETDPPTPPADPEPAHA